MLHTEPFARVEINQSVMLSNAHLYRDQRIRDRFSTVTGRGAALRSTEFSLNGWYMEISSPA